MAVAAKHHHSAKRGRRGTVAGYAAAESTMTFTLGMEVARLIVGALSSLAAGATTPLTAPSRPGLPWVLGAILIAMVIPVHVQLWAKFPIWYHLVFLGTLVPLVALGAALARNRPHHGPARTAF